MAKKALLMVDVQNDFCPGGALAVNHGDWVVKPLNQMVAHALKNDWLILASRDWHPEKTNHFKEWPAHCVQDSPGVEFHPELRVAEAVIVSKGVRPDEDGYSAFDGVTKDGQKLADFLKANSVEEIYIGGLATDYCVKASALDAVKNGLKTCLLLDACRAVNIKPDDENRALKEMREAGVVTNTVREVLTKRDIWKK